MENSIASKVTGEGTIQLHSHNGCITTLQGVCYVPESMYNFIPLRVLHGEVFNFSSEGDLMNFQRCPSEVSSRTYRQCLHVVKSRGYSWWIAVILSFKIEGCKTIIDYDDFELGCSVLLQSRLGLDGVGAQQGSLYHYSCVGVNSHKSCMDRDHWVIKFRSDLNLFDLIKL